jgi:DNA topoisomerase-1
MPARRKKAAKAIDSDARSDHIDPAGGDAPPGLSYVTDDAPGIRRVRRGASFSYHLPDGRPLKDAAQLARIRKLAIPPAYTDVWICPSPQGHLQATGRDARGRKQYRYHAEWRAARDADKFEHMLAFGAALPKIRARVAHDLAQPVGPRPSRASVLATLVRLLDTTLVRVGNDEYARTNGSFGLTTLRNRHAKVAGSTLRLRFRGKSGVLQEVSVDDPRVARVVRRCQAMPGQELFQYEGEDGAVRFVGSADVNDYLRDASGADFTAKDFRTWHATSLALALVSAVGLEAAEPSRVASGKSTANQILAEVAARLGNTVAVCRKSYVHPGVLALTLNGPVESTAAATRRRRPGLTAVERNLLEFLAPTKPGRVRTAARR